MFKGLLNKIKESSFIVLPVTLLIVAIILFFVPTTGNEKINLLICFFLLVIGMTFFTVGANVSMINLGESVGSGLCRTKKMWLICLVSSVIGVIMTVAEPDLQVFAEQVVTSYPGISSQWLLIIVVSIGVGISFLLALLKIIFKLNLPIILVIAYAIIMILSIMLPENFIGMCFDSGSVTTGPISVPFILAFGVGLSSARWRNKSEDDGLGLVALCSAGPIISTMIMCLFIKDPSVILVNSVQNANYLDLFGEYLKDVALVIAPILLIFIIFQLTIIKYPKKQTRKMILGILYTYIGIVLFLVGVRAGYMPLADKIGAYIGTNSKYILLPIGALLGFFCVIVEPALQVLKNRISEITHGTIKPKTLIIVMAIGVSVSVLMATLSILFSISILVFLLPSVILCMILCFINTTLFTGVAFDSGGVATGAMAVSFILPLINGFARSVSSQVGFGTIGLIAVAPILSMQILGFIYRLKVSKSTPKRKKINAVNDIVDFDWEEL